MAREVLDLRQKALRVAAGAGLIAGSSAVGLFLLDRAQVRFGVGILLGIAWLVGFMLIGEAFLGARIVLGSAARRRRADRRRTDEDREDREPREAEEAREPPGSR